MFVDEARIYVKAGDGGNGCVSFRREKFVPRGGPDGGDGGKGGDVTLVADRHLTTLLDFKYQQHVKGGRGQHGMGKDMHGRNGESVRVRVPLGTQVFDEKTHACLADLAADGQALIVAKGGKGGFGNAHFKSSVRQAPRIAKRGFPGEACTLRLVLKLLADVGLIGLPNAGKSTLLSRISAARPKIADYPFTTLTPNLGVVRVDVTQSFVAADIPGLIEGAHLGTGLGDRFLRHIERTKLLVHVVDVSREDPFSDMMTLNQELAQYQVDLSQRPQVVALNKMDLRPEPEKVEAMLARLKGKGLPVFPISAVTGEGVSSVLYHIAQLLQKEHAQV